MIQGIIHPIWRPVMRGILNPVFGSGSSSGYPIHISAPNGTFAGADLVASGGESVSGTIAGTALVLDAMAPTITPYRLIVNGVETGDWFESPSTLPGTLIAGDSVKARDALGRISNELIVESAYFLNSVSGNDANTGLSPAQAFATPGAVMTAVGAASGKTVAVAKGSSFLAQLTLTGDNTLIAAYGSGATPFFDCRDVIGAFTKTAGRTNVYQAAISLPGNSKIQGNAWADTTMLTQVTSLALCDSTPGSSYVANWTAASTTIYVHAPVSAVPITDGKTYRFSRREFGILLPGVNCQIRGVRAIGNAHQDGSIKIGEGALVYGGIVEDGCRHNMLLEPNSSASFWQFIRGRNDLEAPPSANGIVCSSGSVTGKTFTTSDCTFTQGAGGTAFAGAIQHGNGSDLFALVTHMRNTYDSLTAEAVTCKAQHTLIADSTLINCSRLATMSTGGEVTIRNNSGTVNGMTSGGDVAVTCQDNILSVPQLDSGVPGFYRSESAADTPLAIIRDRITITSGSATNSRLIHHKRGAVSVTDTVVLPVLCAQLHDVIVAGFSGGTASFTGARNVYPYGSRFTMNGTVYNTLAEWQAAGNDTTSSLAAFPATVFGDNFNRADAFMDAAPGWTKVGAGTNAAAVRTNQLAVVTAANTTIYKMGALASADHWIRFKVASVPGGASPFVILRVTDQSNWIGVRWNAGAYQTYKCTAGVIAVTGSAQPTGVTAVAGDDVVMGVRGDKGWLYVNGILRWSFPNMNAAAIGSGTACGIHCNSALNPFIDDFTCGIL